MSILFALLLALLCAVVVVAVYLVQAIRMLTAALGPTDDDHE